MFLFRYSRQHAWTTSASQKTIIGSSDKLRGTTQDLFELLERVQCSRLDDQRCVLPAYFSQQPTSQQVSQFQFNSIQFPLESQNNWRFLRILNEDLLLFTLCQMVRWISLFLLHITMIVTCKVIVTRKQVTVLSASPYHTIYLYLYINL